MLGVHFFFFAFFNIQQAIQTPAVFAAAVYVRRNPFFGVVRKCLFIQGGGIRIGCGGVNGLGYSIDDLGAFFAMYHINIPRLGVGA